MSESFDAIILGAGAAGLMCAATAGQRGRTGPNGGSGGNSTALTYVGPGETVTRIIELAGSGGTASIESDGSGALILAGAVSPQIDAMPLDVIGGIGARLADSIKASPLYIRGADAKPQTGFAVQHA